MAEAEDVVVGRHWLTLKIAEQRVEESREDHSVTLGQGPVLVKPQESWWHLYLFVTCIAPVLYSGSLTETNRDQDPIWLRQRRETSRGQALVLT